MPPRAIVWSSRRGGAVVAPTPPVISGCFGVLAGVDAMGEHQQRKRKDAGAVRSPQHPPATNIPKKQP